MFSKILIANRGEVAIRVIRACREMGVATVAVCSEADRDALHVSLSDESCCIGPARARDSYLNQAAIISAALATHAEAIHPGYGFLSENAEFAELCERFGIAFIGAPASVIALMGDKDEARRTMLAAGVPVIPGSDCVASVAAAVAAAETVGYPLMVKARAGGGGRGIRRVEEPAELEGAFNAATAEAAAAFGDGAVYLERFVAPAKHVEMQLIADSRGNVVCLGERDCSVQRKHQKLIEESPCTALTDETRAAMTRSAVAAAKAVDYIGVGTVEFLLDGAGNYYFMEMNTRLQVEHPVTELTTGIDLVKWQLRVASGQSLGFAQADITPRGHALECRVNAEDSANNHRPSGGRVTTLHVPGGPWVRFDTAIYGGYEIPPFYDSLLGKLIVHAATRDEAIRKMKAALAELTIDGVTHNAEYLAALLAAPEFVSGKYFVNSDILTNATEVAE
ncbi:MAG: acetyl-CoA carboxylase biotin carboxylase subunit [Oscillospiraceae bacterium]|jgi:acetyl-CoA carboxylase biotin carboxylase subunit|nr:acetyl-CoA carboxylase biotin carboxylase subunit [Oscillospiraceae bacterium]